CRSISSNWLQNFNSFKVRCKFNQPVIASTNRNPGIVIMIYSDCAYNRIIGEMREKKLLVKIGFWIVYPETIIACKVYSTIIILKDIVYSFAGQLAKRERFYFFFLCICF